VYLNIFSVKLELFHSTKFNVSAIVNTNASASHVNTVLPTPLSWWLV